MLALFPVMKTGRREIESKQARAGVVHSTLPPLAQRRQSEIVHLSGKGLIAGVELIPAQR